jgi:chromate reductase
MASVWNIDPRRSRVSFTARQLGVTVKGAFTCVKGELSIDLEALERSSAHIVIDASSLETALPGFAAILEAKDFLDVEHHPTIEFRSRTIFRSGDRYRITGELTFRGEPREVTVEAGPPDFLSQEAGEAKATSEPTAARIDGRVSLRGLIADEELEVTTELVAVVAEATTSRDAVPERASTVDTREPATVTRAAGGATVSDARSEAKTEETAAPDSEPLTGRPLRILGLAGSYRDGSFNQALLRAAIEEAPAGVVIEPFDLRDVPFYDADLEAAGDPPPVRQLKEAIAASDGLLIATPEYNRGLPARIKNAIDWASRPPFAAPLAGKPVALMGASTGRSGAANAMAHAREALQHSRARVLDRTVAVPRAHQLVDEEGNLADAATRHQIAQLIRELVETAGTAAERAA